LPFVPESVSASFLPSGDHAALTRAYLLDVHGRDAPLERHVGEPFSVGRPGRRHDRAIRLHDLARALAVGVRDDELVFLRGRTAVHRHVGDAGREGAAHADDFLVDRIGDAMRGVAQVRGLHRPFAREQVLPGEHVDELGVDGNVAARQRGQAPYHDVVVAHLLPGGGVDLGRGRRLRDHVGARHALEAAARFEIALHDRGDVEAAVGGHRAREGHDRDVDRIRDARGDGETKLRERGRRRGTGNQQQGKSEFFHTFACISVR
jgi:hypothetical protein